MSKVKNKKLWKNIGIGVLTGALCIGAVAGIGALANKLDEETKIINPSYAIGGLTAQGQYLETKESIYTKNAFECQGLDIEIDFDNNISYRVFFYDAENDFISSTNQLTNNYDETTTPILAKYARIVITPEDDSKISWYEVNKYSSQLEIEVNKEQKESFLFGAKKFDIDSSLHNHLYADNAWQPNDQLDYEVDVTTRIDTENKKSCTIYVNNIKEEICLIARNYDEKGFMTEEDYEIITVAQEFVDCGNGFYSYTFSLPENTTSIRILMGSSMINNGEVYYKLI